MNRQSFDRKGERCLTPNGIGRLRLNAGQRTLRAGGPEFSATLRYEMETLALGTTHLNSQRDVENLSE